MFYADARLIKNYINVDIRMNNSRVCFQRLFERYEKLHLQMLNLLKIKPVPVVDSLVEMIESMVKIGRIRVKN